MRNLRIILLAGLCSLAVSCGTSAKSQDSNVGASKDPEFVSQTTLIIFYDVEVGKEALLQAVKDYGAELLYDYSIIPGVAIKIPEGKHILEAIEYFDKVKGVTAVERDHIYHLTDPVRYVQ